MGLGDPLDSEVPHPHGGRAISIAERQILTLRDKSRQLETKLVELIRFALQGQFQPQAFAVVLVGGAVFFGLALRGYDPQRGWTRQRA